MQIGYKTLMEWYNRQGLKELLVTNCKNGAIYYLFGTPYKLKIIRGENISVEIKNEYIILNTTKENSPRENRNILLAFFSDMLLRKIEDIKNRCEAIVGQKANEYTVEKLSGHCMGRISTKTKHIKINIKHISFNIGFLENTIIHELIHLIAKEHNEEFRKLELKHTSVLTNSNSMNLTE
jgi:predicted metal-dependent hydrolase